MARITKITQEGTKLYVYTSDCDPPTIIDLCVECPAPGDSDDPGDWPRPLPVEDARCRVATIVGAFAADRLADYLAGLNLNIYQLNLTGAHIALKLGQYGWPVSLYGAMGVFTDGLYGGVGGQFAGIGLDAINEYNANPALARQMAREALFCSLSESGEITLQARDLWTGLQLPRYYSGQFGAFAEVLARFLRVWPLDQLRRAAFDASTTTVEVDCSAFTCGGIVGSCENTLTADFRFNAPNLFGWSLINGGTINSRFPSSQLGGTNQTLRNTEFESTRSNETEIGVISANNTPGQPAKPVGIEIEFVEPFVLCKMQTRALARSASLVPNQGNTRSVSILVKLTGQAQWTEISFRSVPLNQSPLYVVNEVEQIYVVDAIAVIANVGGSYITIQTVSLNENLPL